jgi:hypothetical protein
MPKFNKHSMMQEDSINEIFKVGGMRFAKQFEVDLSPENSGGRRIGAVWRKGISTQLI